MLSVSLALVALLTGAQLAALWLFVRGFFPDAHAPPRSEHGFPPLFRARDEPLASAHGEEASGC